MSQVTTCGSGRCDYLAYFRISGQLFVVFLFTPWLHLHRLHRVGAWHLFICGIWIFYFLLHSHSFDGITDVNVLVFMCLELMGQWSWGAVLACKTSFSFIISVCASIMLCEFELSMLVAGAASHMIDFLFACAGHCDLGNGDLEN
jgi:hypothetical protein